MNKNVCRIVGVGIGLGVSWLIDRKFFKPERDKKLKELEAELDREIEKMFDEDERHKKAMEEIDKSYEEWKEWHDNEFDQWVKKFEEKCNGYREKLKIPSEPTNTPELDEGFKKSIELARSVGVPEDRILKTMEDVDEFFLG